MANAESRPMHRTSTGDPVGATPVSRRPEDRDRVPTGRQPDPSPVPVEAIRVGQMFGRLQVIVPDRRLHGKRAAVVRCACGAPAKRVRHEHLLSGDIKSCGCLRAERMETWRRLREDDDAEVAAVQSRTEEQLPESDLLRVTLGRLNCP
jgi:hypothetical protein